MPAVSVIIPAYNAEAFLERAIRSVEAQSFRDFELVVVDDGSTDGTADIARGFDSVRYVRGSHQGEAGARNLGLEEAEGDLVAFVDADDEWLPEKLGRQVAFMEKLGSSFSYTDCYLVRDGSRVRYSTLAQPRHGEILSDLIDDWLDQAFLLPTEVMASRQLLQSAGGFETGLSTAGHVDYGLWLKLALRGTRFDYLDEPLALWYRGHESVSSDAVEMVERYRAALRYFSSTYEFPAEARERIARALARSNATLAVELLKQRRFREALPYLRQSSVRDFARKGRLFVSRRTGRLRPQPTPCSALRK
jgi:teichuronic acid biosynthesis glycosyltransferase TuaG